MKWNIIERYSQEWRENWASKMLEAKPFTPRFRLMPPVAQTMGLKFRTCLHNNLSPCSFTRLLVKTVNNLLVRIEVSSITHRICYVNSFWLTWWNAVDLERGIQGAGFANSKMASFITTMLVSPPFPELSLEPPPAVSTPIQIAPFRTSTAVQATPYAMAKR